MDFRNYNDYEIIDLVKQGNEEALQLMIDKYRYLIAKKIIKFNLTEDFDDYFQEGLLVLYRSVMRFDDTRIKTFTRYFEMNLEHHLISAIRSKTRKLKFLIEKLPMLYGDSISESQSTYYSEDEIKAVIHVLSALEKRIFQRRFIENKDVKSIAEIEAIDVKTVYNAIERIRKKIKLHLDT